MPLATGDAAIQHTNENGDPLQLESDNEPSTMDGVQFSDGDYYDVPLDSADTVIPQHTSPQRTLLTFRMRN